MPRWVAIAVLAVLILGAVWRGFERAAYSRWEELYDWPAERIIYNINCSMDGVDPMWYYPQFHPVDEVTDMVQEWLGLGRYALGYKRPAAVGSSTWHSRHNPHFVVHNGPPPSQPVPLSSGDASRSTPAP